MTDRPILFSAPMVRALLEGRKTQTRRVLNPQPWNPEREKEADFDGWQCHNAFQVNCRQGFISSCYGVCTRLWVRETWTTGAHLDNTRPRDIPRYQSIGYIADDVEPWLGRVRPSIFMPRWASRLTLIVTDVRVQRLQEISEEDAIADGCSCDSDGWRDYQMPATQCCATARDSYRTLWNSLYGPEAWDANPWVSAISFRTIHANIDSTEDDE